MVCPRQDALQAFLEGQLPDPSLGELADHFVDCKHCVEALAALKVQDPLLDMVHSLKGNNLVGQKNEEVEKMVARVCGLLSKPALDDARGTPLDYETLYDAARPTAVCPTIPGYEILDFVDKGGMGHVYKARHIALDKVMALKLCTREKISAALLARFYQEMHAVGRLNHAQIVQAHDAGTSADGVPYLAMEYLEGNDLARLVKQNGPLPIADACEYIRQAALGLQHAHEQNMVHRDLKPANLLLTTGGIVKVLDLGLARLRERAPEPEAKEGEDATNVESLSLTAAAMGTPAYMAPEQWQNAHAVDIRADIYSLGCTLYHLLAGKPPFEGDMLQQRTAHLDETPMPIRQLRPDVPARLSDLLDQVLAKNAAQRPSTPAEVAAALEPFTAKAVVRRSFWAHLWARVAAVVAALALAAGSITYVATDRGTVIVKTDDPDIEVVVKQNGRIIVILDKKSGKEFTLRSGTYDLELQGGKEGLKLSTDRLVLKRGDKKIVEVILEKQTGWSAKAPLPFPTASSMAGVINGQIYLVGGIAGQASFPHVQVYDPSKDNWDPTKTSLPATDKGDAGRYGGSIAVLDGKLHVVGGWRHIPERLPTMTLLIYNPAKDRKGGDNPGAWSRGQSLPIRNGGSLAGVIAGKLYVLTGADGLAGYHKHFHVYDPGTDRWLKKQKSPQYSHVGGAGGVIDGRFYVVGGQDEKGAVAPHLDVYDSATDKWTTKSPMSEARAHLGGAVIDGKLYVVGGADEAGKTLDTVEVYDPVADSWTSLPPLPTPRQTLAVAAIGRTLYAIGGSDGTRLFGTVEALDLAAIVPTGK